MGLTGSQPTEHIRHGDPHVADAWTPSTLAGLNRSDVSVIHGHRLALIRAGCSIGVASRPILSFP